MTGLNERTQPGMAGFGKVQSGAGSQLKYTTPAAIPPHLAFEGLMVSMMARRAQRDGSLCDEDADRLALALERISEVHHD